MAERTQSVRSSTPQTLAAATDASTAQFELPAKRFALTEVFEQVPDARVEIDPAVANPDDHARLVIQTDEHKPRVDAALEAAPCVGMAECLGERDDGWTYHVTWEGRPHQLIHRLVAADITLLSARAQNDRWQLRVSALQRTGIATAAEIMDEIGCGAECSRISSCGGTIDSNRSRLTNEQHEALVTAFEAGYYNIPRDTTTEQLSTKLGISHQALSERLRRANKTLVENNV